MNGIRFIAVIALVFTTTQMSTNEALADAYTSFAYVDEELVVEQHSSLGARTFESENLELIDERLEKIPIMGVHDDSFDLSIYLLENGYATIIDENIATPAQLAAARKGASLLSEVAANEAEPAASEPSILDEIGSSFSTILPWLAGAIGIAVAIFFVQSVLIPFAKFLNREFRTRRVHLIYVGPPAAGKSALHRRLQNPDLTSDAFNKKYAPTTGVVKKDLTPIDRPKLRFVPKGVDTAGSRPEQFLNEAYGRWPWSPTLVVIFCAAATPYEKATATDERFLGEHNGFANMLAGFLRWRKSSKPALLVFLANKVDVFYQNASPDQRKTYLENFRDSRKILEGACKEKKIKYLELAGSAVTGLNTDRLMGEVIQALDG